ncbi:MAG: rhomboid family intramembrane serine protease [Bacteroidales bacterium]|nr:rhomboid family intramembrane serine protease [Bacteroidales bacterium]
MSQKSDIEYKRFILSLIPPAIFVLMLWLIRLVELAGGLDLYYFGIFPRKITGLVGVITAPMIHANFIHLINNTIPFLAMLTAIFYFYHTVAWRVFIYSYLVSGIVVWIIARSSYHIGASGLIYSYGAFLFFSGLIRENVNLLAISLLVSFLYGSMVWGILPYRPDMSWESHLTGMVIGVILAYYFRNEGPPPARFIKDIREDDEEDNEVDDGAGDEAGDEEEEWTGS